MWGQILGLVLAISVLSSCNGQYLQVEGTNWIIRFHGHGSGFDHRITERQGERPVTKRYHSETIIIQNLAETTFSRTVFNPTPAEVVYEYTQSFPRSAVITKLNLKGVPNLVENAITENDRKHMQDNSSSTCEEDSEFSKFSVFIPLGPFEEAVLNLTYQEILAKRDMKYHQQLYLSPGEVIEELSATATIQKTNGVQNVSMSTPELGPLDEFLTRMDSNHSHRAQFRLSPRVQAAIGPKGFYGILQLVFYTEQGTLGSRVESKDGSFIHTINIPGDLGFLPKHVILDLPSDPLPSVRDFIKTFVLGCTENVQPWGQLTILPQSHMYRNLTNLESSKKKGFVNTFIFVETSADRSMMLQLRLVHEDWSETWLDFDISSMDSKEVLEDVFAAAGPEVVFTNLTLTYTRGVDTQSLTRTQFPAVYRGGELQIGGSLQKDIFGKLPSYIKFNLSGIAEKGYFEEEVEFPVTEVSPAHQGYATFIRHWSLLKTRDYLQYKSEESGELKESMTAINLDQGYFTPLVSVKQGNSTLQFSDLVRTEKPTAVCTRRSWRRRKGSRCRIILNLPQARLIRVDDSTSNLLHLLPASNANMEVNSALSAGGQSNLGFLSSIQGDIRPLQNVGHVTHLINVLRNIRTNEPSKRERRVRSYTPVSRSTLTVRVQLEGECCWILFSATNYQGRRETVCSKEYLTSLSTVGSVQKV